LAEFLVRKSIDNLIQRSARENPKFLAFQEIYRDNRVGFVRDCFHWGDKGAPTDYQEDVLRLFDTGSTRVAVKSPHDAGKSTEATFVILHFILTRNDCKVITTASAWRQLEWFLWPEVHKWAEKLNWEVIGREPFGKDELHNLSLRRSPTCMAFAVACEKHQTIEGAHAESILYVFDEAKIIPDATWNAAEGAFAGAGKDTDREALALAISTPEKEEGKFFKIHEKASGLEEWDTVHWTMEQAIEAGQMSREWADNRKREWGEDHPLYQNRVLGNFAVLDEDETLVPLSWIEIANDRWEKHGNKELKRILKSRKNGNGKEREIWNNGVDPAWKGSNNTCIVPRCDDYVREITYHSKKNTMWVAGKVWSILEDGDSANVDVIGIGAGVADRLEEVAEENEKSELIDIVVVNVGKRTKRKDKTGRIKFRNLRSALWWAIREWLDPTNGHKAMLPPDIKLTQDLRAVGYDYASTGEIFIDSKDLIKEKLGRSPDAGDALALSFATGDQPGFYSGKGGS